MKATTGWVWRLGVLVAAVVASSLLGAVDHPPSSGAARPAEAVVPPASVHSSASAAALARSLLTSAVLPPGSTPATGAPVGTLGSPAQRSATPDLAQATRFAVVPGSMAEVAAFLQTHRPHGVTSTTGGTGTLSDHGRVVEQTVIDTITGMPPGVANAQLLLSVAPDGSDAGVRIDAEVTWVPAKPAAATVPFADAVATVSLRQTLPGWRHDGPPPLPSPRQVTVTAPGTVRRLRQAADGLPVRVPGVYSCPADFGTRYIVAFARTAGARADRTFTAGSCDDVTVTGPSGRVVATLADDSAFAHAYRQVLGLPGR